MSEPSTSELLTIDQGDGVVVLKLNRPERKNALNLALRRLLAEAFTALDRDDAVRCIVLTGDEKAFAAGADVNEFAEAGTAEILLRDVPLLWRPIAQCRKPIVAAVNGFAWGGGCELAMHADIIIAGEGASFAQPEIRLGIMPGAGGTQRLVRLVGRQNAMAMLLTAKPVKAPEARTMGLVARVVADDQVLAEALATARDIAAMPPLAARAIKEAVRHGADSPLDAAIYLEQKAFQVLFDTADKAEGVRAFLEKRPANFTGS